MLTQCRYTDNIAARRTPVSSNGTKTYAKPKKLAVCRLTHNIAEGQAYTSNFFRQHYASSYTGNFSP